MTEKPKRPMTAFLLWLNSVREDIKAKNPGIKVTDVAKIGGEMWRKMDDKSEWVEKAAKAKEQYAKDLESYRISRGAGETLSPCSSRTDTEDSESSTSDEQRK